MAGIERNRRQVRGKMYAQTLRGQPGGELSGYLLGKDRGQVTAEGARRATPRKQLQPLRELGPLLRRAVDLLEIRGQQRVGWHLLGQCQFGEPEDAGQDVAEIMRQPARDQRRDFELALA